MKRLTLFIIFLVPILLSPVFYILATGVPAREVVVVTATPDNWVAEQYAAVRAAANPPAMIIRPAGTGTFTVQLANGWSLVQVPSSTPVVDPGSPTATNTLIPTNTPRTFTPSATVPSATFTPSATPTRRPTLTKTPTPTATDNEATPTQDNEQQPTVPTGTPPINSVCRVKVQAQSHALMSDHSATSTRLNWVPKATELTVQRIYIVSAGVDEWVKVNYAARDGWMHIEGNLRFTDDTIEACTDPSVTPTEYASGPTNTPVPTANLPTPTPLPPVTGCVIYNFATFEKNVRAAHTTSAEVVFQIPAGGKAQVNQFYTPSTLDQWAAVLYTTPTGEKLGGWAAVKLGGSVIYQLQGDCSKVPEERRLAVGWHTIQGARLDNFVNTAQYYNTLKTTEGTAQYGAWFKSLNPKATWVHRSIFGADGAMNCPAFAYQWQQPEAWIELFIRTWPQGADWTEYLNECGYGPNLPTFVDFNIRALTYMNARGICGLSMSFASGTPDYPEWSGLVPLLRWIDSHPCKTVNGKPVYNGLSLHGAFCSKEAVPGNNWVTWKDLCNREWIIRNELLKNTGYDLLKFKGPIYMTEIGLDGGVGGTTSDPAWSTEQFLAIVDYSLDLYESQGLIDGAHVWNLGTGGSNWVSREFWIIPLAELLRSRALQ